MSESPLADLLRPKDFSDFFGQEHLVGKDGVVKKLIDKDELVSMIFWGPPGTGKTTLAQIIALKTKSYFVHFSAVSSGVADVKRVVLQAKERKKMYGSRTILFVDEIHRFNKLQQDAFLPYVEDGTIVLIGATTENPSFEVIGPLLSRTRVFVLERLNDTALSKISTRALKLLKLKINKRAEKFLLEAANGDARILLNILELASKLVKGKTFSLKDIENAFQKKALLYDKAGDEHYDTISAFIKSMRASNADAALYYLARMVNAGEDPLFIARRMVIFASEDIGIAQPTALVVANEVFRACETIGYPECQINLAHGVTYLCVAKKDRSAYNGYFRALGDVKKYGNLPIPLMLRNAPTSLMKDLGYGRGYEAYPDKGVSLLPEKLKGKKYF